MTLTSLEQPVTSSSPGPVRRWFRWAAAGLVLALAVGLWQLESWAGSYQPLDRGSLANTGHATVESAVGDNEDVWRLPFTPGVEQDLQLSISNRGGHAVTLDGIPLEDPGTFFGISRVSLRALAPRGIGGPVRFPYRLAPGQEVLVLVSYRLQDCEVSGGQVPSVEGLPVRWHAFGRHHLSTVREPIVAMPVPAGVPATFRKPCPPLPQPENG